MPGPRNDFSDVRFALSYDALKMSGTPQRDGDLRERLGNHRGVRIAFDDARSGNQREGSAAADGDGARHHACRVGHQTMPASAGRAAPDSVLCWWLASMKLANSGCG